jgi:GNAT superfamily N-acetyltransferase
MQTDHRTVIRPFRPEDQDAAKRLILAGMEEHWGNIDPTLNPDLADIASHYSGGTFLLAWEEGEVVGTGALVREMERVARVVRMSVARGRRRQGIGRAILQQLLAEARQAGYRRVVLETTSTWSDAVAFYERQGFHIVGVPDGDTHFALDLD